MAIQRGARFLEKVAKLVAKGFSQKRAESTAAFDTYPKQISRKTYGTKYGR